MSEVRLVIADDQAMVREGFAALLGAQPGLTVVGTAGNGRGRRSTWPGGCGPTWSSWTSACR